MARIWNRIPAVGPTNSGEFTFGADVTNDVQILAEGILWYAVASDGPPTISGLWLDETGTNILASVTDGAAAGNNEWVFVPFDEPYLVPIDSVSVPVVQMSDQYQYDTDAMPKTSPDGHVTATQGRFESGHVQFPTGTWAGWHGFDIQYSLVDETVSGELAGELPELGSTLAGAGTAAGVVAGVTPELADALEGGGTAAAVLGGLLADLAGALAGQGTGVVLLSGSLAELDGQLAGQIPIDGVVTGGLPEMVGPILGVVVGGVTRRLRALATTTVDVYAPAVGMPDEWSGGRGTETLAAGGVVASIIEQTRNVSDPRTGVPRVVRTVIGRVPDGTPVDERARVVDAEGRVYAVSAVRQVRNPVWTGDIVLDLVRTDQQAP